MTGWPPPSHQLPGAVGDEPSAPAGPTLLDWLRIAFVAVRRRKLIATLTFLACVGAVFAYYTLKRPTYRVETRILTLDRVALPTAARSVYEDAPGRSAYDLIHRRDNLIALLQRADLLPDRPGGAPGRDAGGAGPGDVLDERTNALVGRLDKQLEVGTEHGTITISVDWDDPRHAYTLAKAALDNFLEARHLQEVSSIDEVISVLEGHAAKLRRDLDEAIEAAKRRTAALPRPTVPRAREPSAELVRLQTLLAAKQRAVADMEEMRARRFSDLQAQLDRARNSLSDAHPTVIGLRQEIEAAGRESPQVQALRKEEADVRAAYSERLAREGFGGLVPAQVSQPAPVMLPESREEDPRVRQAQTQYEQMTARLNAARVELDAARAAFKYRYNVVWPPQPPDDPVSPNPRKIFGVGLIAALLVAVLAAAAPDVLAGRILHRVQVERALGIPVIGELDRSS